LVFIKEIQSISYFATDLILDAFILPRLVSLAKSTVINPGCQSLIELTCLFQWRDVIQDSFLLELLEQHFFPRWLRILDFWLRETDTSQTQPLIWYKGWKTFFTERDFLYPSVVLQFDRALH